MQQYFAHRRLFPSHHPDCGIVQGTVISAKRMRINPNASCGHSNATERHGCTSCMAIRRKQNKTATLIIKSAIKSFPRRANAGVYIFQDTEYANKTDLSIAVREFCYKLSVTELKTVETNLGLNK